VPAINDDTNTNQNNDMAESTTPSPVEQVKALVTQLQDQRAALLKQVEQIDTQLNDIAAAVAGTATTTVTTTATPTATKRRGRPPGRKPGPKVAAKPGPKAGAKRGRKAAPVSEDDKAALLAAMKKLESPMRSGVAFKQAGLKKGPGKKALAALKADGKVKAKGPWVSLA
jgi:hypothetical protein